MAGKCSLASVLGVFLVFSLFHNPITVAGESIPAVGLFTFGDSNFDAGNKQTLTKANVPQDFWPYGKSRDDPNGKFSDGFIAPDFVAKFMGIPNEIPPALKPNVDISRGASFAVADATLLRAKNESKSETLTFNQQVGKFAAMKKKAKLTDEFIKASVFMIYIGANDYLDFHKNNRSADAASQEKFVTSVTNKLESDIKWLYNIGASKFVIQTLAPLGCLPIVRQDYKTKETPCYEPLNSLAKQHNAKLGPMLKRMATEVAGFQFTVFDFYNVIRSTQRNLNFRELGFFEETNESCCGVGKHNAYGCGMPNVHSKLCEYQRSYLFFDGRHNTEKAQEMFGQLLFEGDTNVIQPMNVSQLIVYRVGEPMRKGWFRLANKAPTDQASDSSRGYESDRVSL